MLVVGTAGAPTTVRPGSTSSRTTEPAPTTAALPEPDQRQDHRPGSDEDEVTARRPSEEHRRRCDVHPLAHDRVVLDDGRGVDQHGPPEPGARTHVGVLEHGHARGPRVAVVDTVAVDGDERRRGHTGREQRARGRRAACRPARCRGLRAPVSRANEIASSSPSSTGTCQSAAGYRPPRRHWSPLRWMTSASDRAWPPAPRTTQSVMGELTGLPCWHPIVPRLRPRARVASRHRPGGTVQRSAAPRQRPGRTPRCLVWSSSGAWARSVADTPACSARSATTSAAGRCVHATRRRRRHPAPARPRRAGGGSGRRPRGGEHRHRAPRRRRLARSWTPERAASSSRSPWRRRPPTPSGSRRTPWRSSGCRSQPRCAPTSASGTSAPP